MIMKKLPNNFSPPIGAWTHVTSDRLKRASAQLIVANKIYSHTLFSC